jgi:hypothetical protein
LKSTVAVGSIGGIGEGETVSVGRICSGVGVLMLYDNKEGCVGV